MRDILVYVASAISKGDLCDNIRRAHEAGIALLKAGVAVIVPHGSCFWGSNMETAVRMADGRRAFYPEVLPAGTTHADWYNMDLVTVRRCDAVLRLPGESTGADLEVAEAQNRGIPVFPTVAEVIAWAEAKERANG